QRPGTRHRERDRGPPWGGHPPRRRRRRGRQPLHRHIPRRVGTRGLSVPGQVRTSFVTARLKGPDRTPAYHRIAVRIRAAVPHRRKETLMLSAFATPEFMIALSQIILINIVLSGDNAVVIALACRSLPAHQQKKAIIFGSVGAIVLRIILTFFAVYLLTLPYLKLVGAALLLWIGIGLLKSEDDEAELEGHSGLMAAVKTIVLADLVMSLDNVVGVAAAAKGNVPLLVFGLVISIPLIIFGST